MRSATQPAREMYYGSAYSPDFLTRNRAHVVGTPTSEVQRMQHMHGRHLSGFGAHFPGAQPSWAKRWDNDRDSAELEVEDDNYGSGIFDQAGRAATSNNTLGVFASTYALPGYVARERVFAVSKDVKDINSGAEVVVVPAGGMAYVERGGRLVGPLEGMGDNVPKQSIVNAWQNPMPIHSLGDDSGVGWSPVTLGLIGAAIGVAAAYFVK